MTTSNQATIELITRNEGLRLHAYQDTVGIWTIGYGHTGPEVHANLAWSLQQCRDALKTDLHKFENGISDLIEDTPTTDNQFGAMIALAYNIGLGNFFKSSVLKYHNAKQYPQAADAFLLWNKAGGRVMAGLVRRRNEERALYLT